MTVFGKVFFCLVLSVAAYASADYIPSDFEACSPSDNKCLIAQGQKFVTLFASGIPELGVKETDPMLIKKVHINLAGLNMNVTDMLVKGVKASQFDDIKLNVKKQTLDFTFHCDLDIKGKYVAGGRLIVLPISGEGDLTAKLKNLNVKINLPFEISSGADGKNFIQLKSYKLKFWIKGNEHAKFKLTNLFGGNKQLASALETFIDSSGELILTELGTPVIDIIAKNVYKQVKKFFESVPYETLVKA